MADELRHLAVAVCRLLFPEYTPIRDYSVFEADSVTLSMAIAEKELAEIDQFLVRRFGMLVLLLHDEAIQ